MHIIARVISADEHLSDMLVTPRGALRIEPSPNPGLWPVAEAGRRVAAALGVSSEAGLLDLATRELDTAMPPAAAFWRDFARHYLTRLCHTPGLATAREIATVPFPDESERAAMADAAPPMRGGEYVNADLLERLWTQLDGHVRAAIGAHPEGAGAWLRERHPLWRMVGRVSFHLAENKRSTEHPFAFLATYATRLSSQARLQHMPLGRALQEYAGTQQREALLNLLEPVQKAAATSALAKEMVDSGRIFKALPWTPAEAHRFLQDVPLFEAAGLVVRLPDWWRAGHPPRPQVSVRIGEHRSAGVGGKALLDFSVEGTLDGEPLTDAEWQALMAAQGGLTLLRGKWVESDPAKLQAALDHWREVEKRAQQGGLSFFEGMRLLAGCGAEGGVAEENAAEGTVARAWAGMRAGAWLQAALADLRDPAHLADKSAIPGLLAELRPYQRVGAHWLELLARLGLGGCLADDMGLGKTVQMLALLLLRKAGAARTAPTAGDDVGVVAPLASLLIVPASLLSNWRAEIQRFAPSLRFAILHPSEPGADVSENARLDLVITTYGMLARTPTLRKRTWDLAILDEAQAIKNSGTRQARAVKELKATARFALTGTPVENRASDLWSLFDFLNPGLLGSAREFTDFIKAHTTETHVDFSALRGLTRPYILRRLKSDRRIIADLPDKTEVRAFCGLSRAQAVLYQRAVDELSGALGDDMADIQRRGIVLAAIMRFKQICNHPSQWLGDGAYTPGDSGKFARLRELAEEIAERQEKALVFTQFREIASPLAGFLASIFGREGLVLHGGTPVAQRRELVEAFQRDDGPPFFVLTVKAGGTGLNLTQAAHVLHFDRWWNPAVENQATDRAFRIGQTHNVLVHKFVCRGTIEERIDELIESKKALAGDLLEGGSERMLTEMNNEELLRFVALDLRRATDA